MTTQDRRSTEERVEQAWGAPGFRENQKEVTKAAVEAFEDEGADVIVLSAPTGFGKSVTLHGIVGAMGKRAYYVTPLKALQDQLTDDDMIGGDLVEIKGRSNYRCALPDEDTTVDKGPCVREDNFDCEIKDTCPYYAQKDRALRSDITVANMSYLMAESMVPDQADRKFEDRDILIVDECQSLEDWAINFVGTPFSKYGVPEMVWENISLPPEGVKDDDDKLADFASGLADADRASVEKAVRYGKITPVDACVKWIEEEVMPTTMEAIEYYSMQPSLSEDAVDEKSKLDRFKGKLDRFLDDVADNEWVVDFDYRVRKNKPDKRKLEFKPVKVGRFLQDILWNRGEKIILSSATIPKGGWIDEMGLGDQKAARFNVPSTFPVENRPIITDEAVGKMTYNERRETIPDMVEKLVDLSERHEGQKGFVHCRGYNYISMMKDHAMKNGYRTWWQNRVMEQDRSDRELALEKWKNGDKQIFMSVAMDEGIDLDGDTCRWQVLLKTLYPHMGDERVSYRVNKMNDWQWYNSKAAIQIQQAYGRGVRSEKDWCSFYVLDESAVGLIDRDRDLFEKWFTRAVGASPVGVEA